MVFPAEAFSYHGAPFFLIDRYNGNHDWKNRWAAMGRLFSDLWERHARKHAALRKAARRKGLRYSFFAKAMADRSSYALQERRPYEKKSVQKNCRAACLRACRDGR